MSERLTGEIIGVGLLDALARKPDAADPELVFIEQVRAQKLAHVRLLERAVRILDGDPARPSPAARRLALSSECLQRIVHGETDFQSALEAVLTAELRNAIGWEELAPKAETYLGILAWEFRGALLEAREHAGLFREWLDLPRVSA